jgi:hypothetical protein
MLDVGVGVGVTGGGGMLATDAAFPPHADSKRHSGRTRALLAWSCEGRDMAVLLFLKGPVAILAKLLKFPVRSLSDPVRSLSDLPADAVDAGTIAP